MVKPCVKVVVGLLINDQQQVCISKRPNGKHLAGLWEFPGGKIEQNESESSALIREFYEELGVTITESSGLMNIGFDYPEKRVELKVRIARVFTGVPYGREGQEVKWIGKEALDAYEFPEANQRILSALTSILSSR